MLLIWPIAILIALDSPEFVFSVQDFSKYLKILLDRFALRKFDDRAQPTCGFDPVHTGELSARTEDPVEVFRSANTFAAKANLLTDGVPQTRRSRRGCNTHSAGNGIRFRPPKEGLPALFFAVDVFSPWIVASTTL